MLPTVLLSMAAFLNHFLIGGNSSTANQILSCKRLLKLPSRAKPRVPLERAILETGVKSDVEFFGGPYIEKTNSEGVNPILLKIVLQSRYTL